ncbi:glutathione S-transferase omega-1-like [Heliangelus exortis]|uniref:glutathione S-transferase omega-1-like n=1 Tax=Heliangelus exortis TaxID=472823 RepID=UPI003A8FF18E
MGYAEVIDDSIKSSSTLPVHAGGSAFWVGRAQEVIGVRDASPNPNIPPSVGASHPRQSPHNPRGRAGERQRSTPALTRRLRAGTAARGLLRGGGSRPAHGGRGRWRGLGKALQSTAQSSDMAGDQSRSFGKGSTAPGPVPEGLIRLYSMRFCPFAQRTRLVLRAKGISHEVININLKNKPDWFFEKSPFGLVPVLETSKGQLIYESPITCEYLDEAFPGKKLMPSDPYERALQKMLLEQFSKITPLVFKYYVAVKDGQDTAALKAEIVEKFGKFEEILSKRNTVFYGGDSISMLDYMIWPWFERLEPFQLKDSLSHTPKLQRWMEAMKEDPAVKATMTDPQIYKDYLQLYLKNSPEACDYGL